MNYAIGIDLGGTNVKAVAVLENGRVLKRRQFRTRDDSRASWSHEIRREIESLQKGIRRPASWVGISAPGLAARDSRSIACMPGRLQGLERLDWARFLGAWDRAPVLNDAHAALLGEVWLGAARGCEHAVLLTLGTGVGGAALVHGRLLKGNAGRAGHLGHACLDPHGPPDVTGMPGSLEMAIGNQTIAARTGGRFSSTEKLVAAYRRGDPAATAAWLRSVQALACAVGSFINILDPQVVILGGGILKARAALLEPLRQFLDGVEWRPLGKKVPIAAAKLGEFAGAFGAAYNAVHFEKLNHDSQ